MTNTLEREPVVLEAEHRTEAAVAAERVGAVAEGHRHRPTLMITLEDERPFTVPVEAVALLADILREMARGHAVTVVPYGTELTTQQVAEILNVSRPYVVKLIETGQLEARKVGPRRRVRFEHLMGYKHADDERRRRVARDLTREAEGLSLGYQR